MPPPLTRPPSLAAPSTSHLVPLSNGSSSSQLSSSFPLSSPLFFTDKFLNLNSPPPQSSSIPPCFDQPPFSDHPTFPPAPGPSSSGPLTHNYDVTNLPLSMTLHRLNLTVSGHTQLFTVQSNLTTQQPNLIAQQNQRRLHVSTLLSSTAILTMIDLCIS